MSYAVVFPGQGSQSVGMLQDLYDDSQAIRDIFKEASDILGYDVWQLVSLGPKERLNQTEFTQPTLLASCYAIWKLWCSNNENNLPKILSGHSLGEYTALVASEAISFSEALILVQKRGRLMQDAVPSGEGAMLAVLGLDDDKITSACDNCAEGEILAPANFNSPGQVVVAGAKSAIERLTIEAKSMGAKRTVLLPVSVPSHCLLLKDAADEFMEYLNKCNWSMPKIPVIHNRNASTSSDVPEMLNLLREQMFSPVLWVDVITRISNETRVIVEMGPGAVLSGLNKRINRDIESINVNSIGSVNYELEKI